MNNKNKLSPFRMLIKNSGSVLALTAILAMLGCATTRRLATSPTMPAAEGNVAFSATRNNNTRIRLRVKHLAYPEKLTPPASIYVVWIRATKDAQAQNIGALVINKNLVGELDTETPLHSFELFITAEASGQVQSPAGQFLLWTSYSRF